MQIVLAKIEEEQVIERLGRVDIGESHKFKTVKKPIAAMWLGKATERDIPKAQAFADKEGYRVFTYKGERDPLGRAKREMLQMTGATK